MTLTLNGRAQRAWVEPRRTLLELLRLDLGLTGAKHSCGEGHCGACTVLLDGAPIYACLMLALDAEGREVTTIEGVAAEGRLHPIQEAFLACDAYQCGYCTPGQVMAAIGLLAGNPHPTPEEIRRGLSGNLCRCGAYPRLLQAVLEVAGRRP